MAVDDRMRAQAQLILDSHPAAATHPAADQWDDADNIDYFYRAYAILVREPDATASRRRSGRSSMTWATETSRRGTRGRSRRESVTSGLVRLTVPRCPHAGCRTWSLASTRTVGPGVAKPEHKVYVCPWSAPRPSRLRCRVSGAPVPPPGLDAGGRAHPLDRERRGGRFRRHRGHRADSAGRRRSSLAGRGGGRGGGPVTRRRRDDRSVRRPRDVRGRDPALRRPEGVGLRRAGVRHRGRRLRDEARVQPGGRP